VRATPISYASKLLYKLIKFIFNVFPFLSIGKGCFGLGNRSPRRREFSIEFDEGLLIARYIIFSINGIYRALWDAYCTVNTLVWINDQKIRTFAEAVDWANINAVSVFAADTRFSNNVSHGGFVSRAPKRWVLGYKSSILAEIAYFSGERVYLVEVKFLL
jgi:hypothetical protein